MIPTVGTSFDLCPASGEFSGVSVFMQVFLRGYQKKGTGGIAGEKTRDTVLTGTRHAGACAKFLPAQTPGRPPGISPVFIPTETVNTPDPYFTLMAEEKYKIVVFGAFGAGKSTLIQTLDPQAKHIEAECTGGTTTVALDYGRVQIGERRVYLYGTPGQERFEFAREIIGKGMDGAILLVDVTSPVDEFIDHLHVSIRAEKIPFVVLLNKCDTVGAQQDAVTAHFAGAEIRPVSAKDRKQARDALEGFIGTLRPHTSGNKPAA